MSEQWEFGPVSMVVYEKATGAPVASLSSGTIRGAYDDDTIRDRGNKIKATPDMYEALNGLFEFCDGAGADHFDSGETEAARIALAKARGETP